jgi:hypothetical protein
MTEAVITYREMIQWIDGQIWSKTTWLDGVGNKRPKHEIEAKRYDLHMLKALRDKLTREQNEKSHAAHA